MKKHLLCLLCVLSVFSLLFYKNVHAGSRYCILAQDGRILAGEGMHEKQSVASISKIMTAIVALEHSSLSRRIVIGKEIYSVDGSSVYLREKEVWSLKDLLYGLLLRSGNDAAASIAKDIGGSEETFVAWMNEKAKEIGMNDTLFRNPSGLDEADGGNVSTVYDMAVLMNYAMKNQQFVSISSARSYTNEKGKTWINKNRLLRDYEYAVAGKTGYTKQAGRTLVSSARKNNLSVVIVTFGMSDDFAFHEEQYEKAFSSFKSLLLIDKGTYLLNHHSFEVEEPAVITISKEEHYQVSEEIDKNGYRLQAETGQHSVRYEYGWR